MSDIADKNTFTSLYAKRGLPVTLLVNGTNVSTTWSTAAFHFFANTPLSMLSDT